MAEALPSQGASYLSSSVPHPAAFSIPTAHSGNTCNLSSAAAGAEGNLAFAIPGRARLQTLDNHAFAR